MTPKQRVFNVLNDCHINIKTPKAEIMRITMRVLEALKDNIPPRR